MDQLQPKSGRRQIFAWAMYDFANSGYTTVVLTAVFNAYFVGVVAAELGKGAATLYWTLAVAGANALVLFSAPLIGAIADHGARKKRFLAYTTVGCVIFTAMLAWVGPGDVALAMLLVLLSNLMFASGENLIAAFLPQISRPEDMGRISAYGWSLGYVGGLIILGVCLLYVTWAQKQGISAENFVPVVMLIVAAAFALAAVPTFLFLPERAQPERALGSPGALFAAGWHRLLDTLRQARHFEDLFRFLLCLTVYNCGIYTVIVLAAIYAQEVVGFTSRDTMFLVMLVNVTAALGAFGFGLVQDRIGSLRTLSLTLCVWIAAILTAYFTQSAFQFWIAANLVGIALGASQSAGRALIGMFTPEQRSGEFFGLWGMAVKLSAIIGPLSYGLINYASGGEQRIAILSTLVFFVAGLILLFRVDESRGREAARIAAK